MKTCYRLRVAARPIWRFVGLSVLMAPSTRSNAALGHDVHAAGAGSQIGLAGPRHDEGRADDRDVVSPRFVTGRSVAWSRPPLCGLSST
jgi:hypothetical protein